MTYDGDRRGTILAGIVCIGVFIPPAAAQEIGPLPTVDEVRTFFDLVHARKCGIRPVEATPPPSWDLSFNYASDALDTPPYRQVLYAFPCLDDGHVYILAGEREGIHTATFVHPELSVKHRDSNDPRDVEDMAITGYAATDLVFNSVFDPETRTLTEHIDWQPDGYASSEATWKLVETRFILVRYAVDAALDEKVERTPLLDLSPP